jgi:hypothetical protein
LDDENGALAGPHLETVRKGRLRIETGKRPEERVCQEYRGFARGGRLEVDVVVGKAVVLAVFTCRQSFEA